MNACPAEGVGLKGVVGARVRLHSKIKGLSGKVSRPKKNVSMEYYSYIQIHMYRYNASFRPLDCVSDFHRTISEIRCRVYLGSYVCVYAY